MFNALCIILFVSEIDFKSLKWHEHRHHTQKTAYCITAVLYGWNNLLNALYNTPFQLSVPLNDFFYSKYLDKFEDLLK